MYMMCKVIIYIQNITEEKAKIKIYYGQENFIY